jgi:hypothetical protein
LPEFIFIDRGFQESEFAYFDFFNI